MRCQLSRSRLVAKSVPLLGSEHWSVPSQSLARGCACGHAVDGFHNRPHKQCLRRVEACSR